MNCQCSHADGYHLQNMFNEHERKCFYEDCDCETNEKEKPPSAVK